MARAMKKVQMEHALERLSEAYRDILGDQPKGDSHAGLKGRAALIKSGEVTIDKALIKRAVTRFNRKLQSRWPDTIESCIEKELEQVLESKYTPVIDQAMVKWEKRRDKLDAKFREAKDEIILGDVDRALKLIAAFRKTKV